MAQFGEVKSLSHASLMKLLDVKFHWLIFIKKPRAKWRIYLPKRSAGPWLFVSAQTSRHFLVRSYSVFESTFQPSPTPLFPHPSEALAWLILLSFGISCCWRWEIPVPASFHQWCPDNQPWVTDDQAWYRCRLKSAWRATLRDNWTGRTLEFWEAWCFLLKAALT